MHALATHRTSTAASYHVLARPVSTCLTRNRACSSFQDLLRDQGPDPATDASSSSSFPSKLKGASVASEGTAGSAPGRARGSAAAGGGGGSGGSGGGGSGSGRSGDRALAVGWLVSTGLDSVLFEDLLSAPPAAAPPSSSSFSSSSSSSSSGGRRLEAATLLDPLRAIAGEGASTEVRAASCPNWDQARAK